MNFKRALSILAKFFVMNEEAFSHALSKATIIAWAEQVKEQTVQELGDVYQLTQQQHAFLIGEIFSF